MKDINNILTNLYNNSKTSYYGPINDSTFIFIEKKIKKIKKEYPKTGKRLSKIFIELFQNILLYSFDKYIFSEQKEIGCGAIVITETENNFKITTSNLTQTKQIDFVTTECEHINSLNRNDLRKLKIEKRKSASFLNDNAGIGLIQILLNSYNPINFDVQSLSNELGFLSLTATVQK